ncbi:unnamed protein product [Mytilus coruscus]|uniref:G-protein coupled receptors family 1 profile domain-containing protein n=1 Tax=Mytilus coruscus TaxID=42192 RepID=A0A6J8BRP0_MYTCO|nr:unnamed protein product [Mytilus coruscus]
MNNTVTEMAYFYSETEELLYNSSTVNDINTSIMSTPTEVNTSYNEAYPLLAPMIFVGCLTMIGIPGNILVLLVYSMKRRSSAQRTIILAMAVYDLLVCTITLPFEFYDLFIHLNFPELWICKIFRTLNYFFVFNSSSIMQVMTIERFRRVCRPLKIQMSAKIALSCMITICIASSVVTIPNLFIRGIHTVRLGDNDTGHDCSIADKFIGSKLETEELLYNSSTVNDINTSIMSTPTEVNTSYIEAYPLLAPMIFVGCLTMIGIPGNILVLLVYSMKRRSSAQRTIILAMAVYDLLVCTITLPF